MKPNKGAAAIIAIAGLLVSAACGASSSGTKSPGPSGSAATQSIKVGLLTDLTGPAASGNKSSVDGLKAGVVYAARQGVKVSYVVVDTGTTPGGALAGARKLVVQDHVSVVIAHSAVTFSAANYLTARGVPVVGSGEDGPEWITAKNMFSVFGALNTTKVADTTGKFFKAHGVTTLGSVGYSISPISSENAKALAEASKSQGIKVGYLNAHFPFGSTDVQPVVLAMKSAGVDGFSATTDPNTAFAFITALRQAGVDLKVAMLAIGYGGDLLQAGPGALNAAQNVYFTLAFEPVEMKTPATKQLQSDLAAVQVSAPTFAIYNTYTAVGLVVRALKAAGSTRSAALISALSNIHDWDALGLFGSHKLDLSNRSGYATGVDNCIWVTKLKGKAYEPVEGALPICGTLLPGVTVAPST